MHPATREAVEASRREAVEARVAAFKRDLESVAPHRAHYVDKVVAAATLASAHRREASTALPAELLSAWALAVEIELRRLLA